MDILLEILIILNHITTWALRLSPVILAILAISVAVDIFKKKFYWSKFALLFVATTIILIIIQFPLGYEFTKSIINGPSQESTLLETANWKTYTNSVGKFTIKYPSSWTINETHELSNRTVDDPKEINTTTLDGKEGQIVLQWGPMGFGGGCDEKDKKTLQLQDISVEICNGINNNSAYWSQIYPPKNHEPGFGASATGIVGSKSLIEKIFSTLSFY